jgi:hypothetical protein
MQLQTKQCFPSCQWLKWPEGFNNKAPLRKRLRKWPTVAGLCLKPSTEGPSFSSYMAIASGAVISHLATYDNLETEISSA